MCSIAHEQNKMVEEDKENPQPKNLINAFLLAQYILCILFIVHIMYIIYSIYYIYISIYYLLSVLKNYSNTSHKHATKQSMRKKALKRL